MIELPSNKHKAWTVMIHAILKSAQAKFKELEELIGCLNHAGFIISLACHFLGRLRMAQYAANHRHNIKMTDDQCKDLQCNLPLWSPTWKYRHKLGSDFYGQQEEH